MINVLQDNLFKPFVIYRSSAGSGKTYTLALEYLKLALSRSSYRNILAVTFTNKATKEMKSRILEFLYQLAQDKPNDGVREALLDSIRISDEQLTEKARYLLSSILHGYSFFSVMTIDTFFQKVVRSFAREMGLQAGFKLEMDTNKVLDDVIDQMLMDVGTKEKADLTRWLVEFASEKVELGRSWDFRRDIKHLSVELFKEEFKLKEGDLLQAEGKQLKVVEVLKEMKKHVSYFENTMQEIGQKAVIVMENHGLSVMDFPYNNAGIMGYFAKLANNEIFRPGTRVLKALETEEAWYAKKSTNKDAILQAVEDGLYAAVEEVVSFCEREHETYMSAQQALRFIYTFGILADVSEKLDHYKQENDFMLISDAPLFLKEIIGKDETPFIYEKIGTTFNHFLIDEFQDTSGFQWDNFRPLVENSLDSGFQNLVVGDIKQSIYRWRGGDWRLLLEQIQQDISPMQTEVKNLDKNFRSKRNIIDFNNSLFDILPKLFEKELQQKVEESDNEAVIEQLYSRTALISEAYLDAHQHLPETKNNPSDWPGYIRIEMVSKEDAANAENEEEATDIKTHTLKKIPQLIEDLQEKGYRPEDIAFLVRRKDEGKAVANELMMYKGEGKAKDKYSYEVVSSESLFLESSLCVTFLIDVLTFLNNPKNNIARAGVLYKYRRIQSKDSLSEADFHDIFNSAAGEDGPGGLQDFLSALPLEFIQQRSYLNQLPLFELIEQLIRIFNLGATRELSYLQAFQDAVLDYSNTEHGDIYSFLTWWYEQGHQRSVQASEQLNAMRILTIHKAKGLQFKVVIMPFCDWSLDHHPFANNILWLQAEQKPLSAFGPMPLKYGKTLKDTVYRQDYYEEMIRAFIDNLNLLYVAFTRAEECLYAFAQTEISTKGVCKLTSVSNALYLAFTEENPTINQTYAQLELHRCWQDDVTCFELGTPPQPAILADPNREEKYLSSLLTTYPSSTWRNKLTVRQKATQFFVQEENTDKEQAIRINYGILLRDLLLRMHTAQDLDRTLQEIFFERGITEKEKQYLSDKTQQILQHPVIGKWFNGSFPQVKTGASILVVTGQEYHPDRVLLSDKKTILVNFRLGQKENANHFAYLGQIKKYIQLLKQMGYPDIEGYLVYIESLAVEKITS